MWQQNMVVRILKNSSDEFFNKLVRLVGHPISCITVVYRDFATKWQMNQKKICHLQKTAAFSFLRIHARSCGTHCSTEMLRSGARMPLFGSHYREILLIGEVTWEVCAQNVRASCQVHVTTARHGLAAWCPAPPRSGDHATGSSRPHYVRWH